MADERLPPLDSVDRALRLAHALRGGQPLSVKAAAELLGVAPSTAHRLLHALSYRSFALQLDDRTFRAGPALSASTEAQQTTHQLRAMAYPGLEYLHAEVAETAQLMVRQGTQIRFVDGIESDLPLRVGVRIGDLLPAHSSAGGKVLLAELEDWEIDGLYGERLPVWPLGSLRTVPDLKEHLATVRRHGYGLNHDETELGVSGVGAVVRDADGTAIAAFTLAIPSARFAVAAVPGYVAALQHACALVTA